MFRWVKLNRGGSNALKKKRDPGDISAGSEEHRKIVFDAALPLLKGFKINPWMGFLVR